MMLSHTFFYTCLPSLSLHNTTARSAESGTTNRDRPLCFAEAYRREPSESPSEALKRLCGRAFCNPNQVEMLLIVLDDVSFVQNNSLPSRAIEIRIPISSERCSTSVVRRENHVVIQKALQLPGISPDTQFEQCSVVDHAAAKRIGLQMIHDFILPEIKKRERADDERAAFESNGNLEVRENVLFHFFRSRTDRFSVLSAIQEKEREHGDGFAETHFVRDDASLHFVQVRRVFERRQTKQGAEIERCFVGKEVSLPHSIVIGVSFFVEHVLSLLALYHPKQRLQLILSQHDAVQSLKRRNGR